MPKAQLMPAEVRIEPATSRADDACAAVSPGCWCMIPRFPEREVSKPEREAKLRELCTDDDPPGLIAYVDGEVAGWIGFGSLEKLPSLRNSTRLTQVDDAPAWTIVCFRVGRRHQGRGLSRMLLEATIDFARERDVPLLQAYPADPPDGRMNSTNAYVGVASMFERYGFERVVTTPATSNNFPRILMRLRLDNTRRSFVADSPA